MEQNNSQQTFNLVLTENPHRAIRQLHDHSNCSILCVVSQSPRAQAFMTDEHYLDVMTRAPQIMTRMTRLELHYNHNPVMWTQAKALSALIRGARNIVNCLLHGMLIKGTAEEMLELGEVLATHPSLRRLIFFNIAAHPATGLSLNPMVERVRTNQRLQEFACRFMSWPGPSLSTIVDSESRLVRLCLTGKDILGRGGSFIPALMTAMKSNRFMKELTLNRVKTPQGTGAIVADMLKSNKRLLSFNTELYDYDEFLPVAQVVKTDNKTLKSLGLCATHHPGAISPMLSGRRAIRRLLDEGNLPPSLRAGMQNMLDNMGPEPPEPVLTDAIKEEARLLEKKITDAFELALETNTSLQKMQLLTQQTNSVTKKMSFFFEFNKAGRGRLMARGPDITSHDLGQFLVKNAEHTGLLGMIWYILRMNPHCMEYAETALEAAAMNPSARRRARRASARASAKEAAAVTGERKPIATRKKAPAKKAAAKSAPAEAPAAKQTPATKARAKKDPPGRKASAEMAGTKRAAPAVISPCLAQDAAVDEKVVGRRPKRARKWPATAVNPEKAVDADEYF